MKKRMLIAGLCLLILFAAGAAIMFQRSPKGGKATVAGSIEPGGIPVKGMVTMVDLGANECIPCKMMVPIMEKVEKKYEGKAAIIFIDVWKDKEPAKRFGIRTIPTQIFFNEQGKEVYRHVGFMSEAEIDRIFEKMGLSQIAETGQG